MIWKRYKGSHRTTVTAIHDGQPHEVTMEIGTLLTGKTRSHSGYYCRTTVGEVEDCIEAETMYKAVRAAANRLRHRGYILKIYVMRPDLYETFHCSDTGWCYVEGIQKSVLMIDEIGVIRESPGTSETRIGHHQLSLFGGERL